MLAPARPALLAATLLALTASLTLAVAADAAAPTKPSAAEAKAGLGKVSGQLLEARRLHRASMSRADIQAALPSVRMAEDDGVDMELRLWQLTPEIEAAIAATGVSIVRADETTARVIAHGSLETLEALSALPAVSTIHPLYGSQHRTGSVDDAADAAMGAAQARATYDVDGSGIKVGIVSDSFNDTLDGTVSGSGCARTLTGTAPQRSGDLPASVTVLDSGSGGADEGAGMAELVHDLAPGADILFHAGGDDESAFAAGVDQLRSCGAQVIVDDLIFFAEPMFQDGPIAQAERRAVAAGVPVFSAAGNEATFGVSQTIVDANGDEEEETQPTGVDLHDFGGGQHFAAVSVPAGCGIGFVLQWAEPFSGTLGPGAATDLDLWVYSAASPTSTIVAASVDPQGCARNEANAGDPLEIATYTNRGTQPKTLYVAIDHFCGSADPAFRLTTFPLTCNFPGRYAFDTTIFHDPQIYGHPAAEGVAAVGAVDVRELASNGTAIGSATRIDPETFSSLGGDLVQTIDDSGQSFADGPHFRFKPELAAPDGSNTSFFGTDSAADSDTFPNFFGTSAAAPHAAAVAALLRQKAPDLSPAALLSLLQSTARDIGAAGVDPISGAGAVDAEAAFAALAAAATPTAVAPTPTATPSVEGDCDGNGVVNVDDLVRGVSIALDQAAVDTCTSLDRNGDGRVSIDELVAALNLALDANLSE